MCVFDVNIVRDYALVKINISNENSNEHDKSVTASSQQKQIVTVDWVFANSVRNAWYDYTRKY